MNLIKKSFSNITIPGFIKNAGLILLATGVLSSCNNANKKEDNLDIEESLEVDKDSIGDNEYNRTNAVADYLIYMDGEGKYEDMETKPEKAIQKFAAAVSERSREFGMQVNEKVETIGDSLKEPTENMKAQLENTVMALEKLQKNSYNELSAEVEDLKADLKDLDVKAEDSKEKLRAFFAKAADVIDDMDAPNTDSNTMSKNPGAAIDQNTDTIEVQK